MMNHERKNTNYLKGKYLCVYLSFSIIRLEKNKFQICLPLYTWIMPKKDIFLVVGNAFMQIRPHTEKIILQKQDWIKPTLEWLIPFQDSLASCFCKIIFSVYVYIHRWTWNTVQIFHYHLYYCMISFQYNNWMQINDLKWFDKFEKAYVFLLRVCYHQPN